MGLRKTNEWGCCSTLPDIEPGRRKACRTRSCSASSLGNRTNFSEEPENDSWTQFQDDEPRWVVADFVITKYCIRLIYSSDGVLFQTAIPVRYVNKCRFWEQKLIRFPARGKIRHSMMASDLFSGSSEFRSAALVVLVKCPCHQARFTIEYDIVQPNRLLQWGMRDSTWGASVLSYQIV
jgi:hypothetical protein